MSSRNIIFIDKKNGEINFYKIQNLINIDHLGVNKILVSKNETSGQKNRLNTLLDMMIMMRLCRYVKSFLK